MFRKILQFKLKILSKIIIKKYKPYIIGITGSVGKTSTKEAVYRVLKKRFRVRRSKRNYNNEIGVPLSIIGAEDGNDSLLGWFKIFLKAGKLIVFRSKYPDFLILEMGIDKPGDMSYLVNLVKPNVAIMTAIGEFPVHIEFFPEKGKLVEEKTKLINALPLDGLAILNYDDLSVRDTGRSMEKKKIYYGFGDGSDLKIFNFQTWVHDLEKKDFGLSFKLDYKGSAVPVKLNKVLGKHHSYAVAAATAVGLSFGMNLVEISSSLTKYRSLSGRANVIKGVKNSWIIDDSYNASPSSTLSALEILDDLAQHEAFNKKRRLVVLGDMLELGQETEKAHRQVGEKVAKVSDLVFLVGSKSRFIADEAIKQGFPEDKIFQFDTSEEVKIKIQKKIKKNDIVLIKGSRSMHMEKAVKEIMAKPQKADKILVK